MSNVTKFGKKVNDQVHELMENVSWVVGIDVGKEKLSCALMNINKALICRFDVEGSLPRYRKTTGQRSGFMLGSIWIGRKRLPGRRIGLSAIWRQRFRDLQRFFQSLCV